MPPTIAARWMTCEQPSTARGVAQVAGVHLARLPHPVRRLALVGDAHLPVGVTHEAADHGGADGARAARDEDARHPLAPTRASSSAKANT
jgi:hypothetical protein